MSMQLELFLSAYNIVVESRTSQLTYRVVLVGNSDHFEVG